ncbi:MAG TPA: MprA protease, GlyGly-CTERM protein-sorting domain-containing form [Acidimicrobiia bacterium]|nr:MprA protease, GlyGly-CTERM protein-sorting domain-containing form [Acidimicrobiia bacterium]
MNTLVGTGHLIRLIARRDRFRLSVWVLVLALLAVGTASAFIGLYPSEIERQVLANTIASNPAIVAFLGPVYDTSIGGLTAWRVGVIGSVLIGVMAALTMIRHTREEEETGRRELLGATVVGRNAPLTASLIVTAGAGLVLGVLCAAGMIGLGLPIPGSVAFGLGYACVTAVFAGLSGLAAQLTQGAGAARGIAIAMIGASFLLRLAGDGGTASGLGWLSWLSPVGWFTQLRPFAEERWPVLGLSVGLALLATLGAYWLAARRDVGAGVVQPRPGPASAAPSLSSPLGLAWRLHRPSLFGWTLGLCFVGSVYGSIADSVGGFLGDNPQLTEIFERLGGEAGITEAYFATAMGILALIATAYAVRSALRLRVEEESLRADSVLATTTPRLRWAGSHLVFAVLGPVLILALSGVIAGAIYGSFIGDVAGQVPVVLEAAMIQIPAVWVVVGIAVALFGLAPKLSEAVWGVLVAFFLLGQLGRILQFPQWSLNLSPFSHIPALPAAELTMTPLLVLTSLAVLLVAIGLAGFQRRDVAV